MREWEKRNREKKGISEFCRHALLFAFLEPEIKGFFP
jgi:hypothetical protein